MENGRKRKTIPSGKNNKKIGVGGYQNMKKWSPKGIPERT